MKNLVLAAACCGLFISFAHAQQDMLKAVKVDKAPAVDGDPSDEAWAKAPALSLAFPEVSLKAVYTNDGIYLLARWPDTTFSIVRGGSWTWDGAKWTMTKSAAPEAGPGMSEDRLTFMWNMTVPDFEGLGCMTKCHVDVQPGKEKTVRIFLEAGVADIWHMKSARALPSVGASQSGEVKVGKDGQPTAGTFTLTGYCDDQWVGEWKDTPDGGRYSDEGKGASSPNQNKEKTGPLYIETAPADYIDAMTLRQTEIDAGEAVEAAGLDAAKVSDIWAKYTALGARVPECILTKPEGSRADITQAAVWKDGVWTTEFRRDLDTGHSKDDAIFKDLTKPYLFGIAILDNCGGKDHVTSGVIALVFEQ
ncbi:MAG: ethylbenzene dehydrogenase-related protein [Planctomycetota bacterium]